MVEDREVPPSARLVRDFVNTREPQTGREELTTPAELGRWLAQRVPGGAPGPLTPADVAVAVSLREGLRAVLLGHAGHEVPAVELADLAAALEQVPVRMALTADGPRLVPAGNSPLAQALAPVVDAVRASAQDQSWQRLKTCSRDTCRWAYYDGSRNQSRRWCSMAGCGNYTKMRRRAAGAQPAS